jgi:hypothetical protein
VPKYLSSTVFEPDKKITSRVKIAREESVAASLAIAGALALINAKPANLCATM